MPSGKVELKSAGALAMGPDGILFVGDSVGGAIVALDVDDRTPAKSAANLEIKGINEKIAAMLGTAADQILIQDVVVNPISKNVYIAVSRGTRRRRRSRDPARRSRPASSPKFRSPTSSTCPSALLDQPARRTASAWRPSPS